MNRFLAIIPLDWRIKLREFAPMIVSGAVFLAAAVTYFVLASPDGNTHAGYVSVDTISTFDTTTDSGFSFSAVVRLPDGAQATISTSSPAAAQWFSANTCVELRQLESGRVLYRLAAPSNCLP